MVVERRVRAVLLSVALGLGAARARGDAPPSHWAFQLPVRPAVPGVQNAARARSDIDRFVLALLEEKGLDLSPEAAPETLVRRVSFDLTGLPPSPSEIAAFLSDRETGAYERMVERYLASPQYGERWGRHWLDAAGYADSNGYFSADSVRPLAYAYRDYVVRSLNEDKPFDRFITEQIAGDELAGYEPGGDVTPDMVDRLTATHFLRNPQDGTGESDGNEVEVLMDKLAVLDGTVQMVGSALLGLTLQCARCHDHKFDPVTQVEYYRMQAVFAGAYDPGYWVKPNDRTVEVGTRSAREEHARKSKAVDGEIKALQGELEGIAAPFRRRLWLDRIGLGTEQSVLSREASRERKRRSGFPRLSRPDHDELAAKFRAFAAERSRVEKAIQAKEKERPAPLSRLSILFESRDDPSPHRLLKAGIATDPGEAVEPGVPAVLCSAGNPYLVNPAARRKTSTGRRLAFARWLTSPEHPLLARVTANRIWQHHLGVGIVETPENFGKTGAPPTHRALLDYLATELVRSGWSMKSLHRSILVSAAYRQSSAFRPEAAAVDPENRLLWRARMRRLDAESVRDAMLCVSGEIDRAMGGSAVPTSSGEDGQVVADESKPGAFRRSLYLEQRRTSPVTLLEVFDCPLMVSTAPRRGVTTTPLQSLALLNARFAVARAVACARRLEREAGESPDARLALATVLAFGRAPTLEERTLAAPFLEAQVAGHGGGDEGKARAWADLCQMLLASNAFLYVD
jgi:hypothetical protein